MLFGARQLEARPCCCSWASPEPCGNLLLARVELCARRSSVDVVVVGEMDSAPLPASGASLDVVVNELPMDFNGCFICTNGEPVSPHTRRPYCGHGARTVGGGVKR